MNNQTRRVPTWWWVSGAIAVVAIIAGVWFFRSGLAADEVAASSSPSATPSAASSAPPSVTHPATPGQASAPGQASTPTDANDPGNGVATDAPVPAPTAQAPDGRQQVTVVVTRWGMALPFEAAGFVEGVSSAGGTCSLTLERDGVRIVAAGADIWTGRGVDCGNGLTVNDDRLRQGTWQMTLHYESDAAIGTSEPIDVTLQ